MEGHPDYPIPRPMTKPYHSDTDDIIRALLDHAPIKVWSYLATIFGDLAGEAGDEISGVVLSSLTERAGIKPEAMRVALHRLRKDDWIVARKVGRNSLYRLSDRGLAETQRASRRIYARTIPKPERWHLLIADPVSQTFPPTVDDLTNNGDYLAVSSLILLGTGPCPPLSEDVLALDFTRMTAPQWLLHNAIPEESEEVYSRTAELLTKTADALNFAESIPALDQATIRLLSLHHWRRIVLRHAPLIEMLYDKDWNGAKSRAAMARILDRLPRLVGDI